MVKIQCYNFRRITAVCLGVQIFRSFTYTGNFVFCSENQHFLKEVVSSVLEGQGISWLKHSRVKKLMEDENYRNFVVSRLNKNLDKKLTDDDHHIEDVVCTRPPIQLLHRIYQWDKHFLFLAFLEQNLEIRQCYTVRHSLNFWTLLSVFNE